MANQGPRVRVDDGRGNLLNLSTTEARAYVATHPGSGYAETPVRDEDGNRIGTTAAQLVERAAQSEDPAVDLAAIHREMGALVRVDDGEGNLTKLREGEVAAYLASHPGSFRSELRPVAQMLGLDRRAPAGDEEDEETMEARLLRQSRPQINSIAVGLGLDPAAVAAAPNKGAVAEMILAEHARQAELAKSDGAGDDDGLEALDDNALNELLEENELDATDRDGAIAALRAAGVKAPSASQDGQDGAQGGQDGQQGGNSEGGGQD